MSPDWVPGIHELTQLILIAAQGGRLIGLTEMVLFHGRSPKDEKWQSGHLHVDSWASGAPCPQL